MPERFEYGYPPQPPEPEPRALWKDILAWFGITHWRGKKIE